MNTTLYAQWVSTLKTVTFNNNGGTGTMAAQTACVSTALTTNSFTRAGYTFAGWNSAANGSGTAYANGANYSFAADITLYAQWTPNNNVITFDKNAADATGTTATQTLATGATANLNTNGYTRIGYTFAGWATTAAGTIAYTDGQSYTMGTANVILYAKWTPQNYKVIFDKNDASATGTMANQTIPYQTTANLTSNAFAKTGYIFKEWNTAANGSGTSYANSASFTMNNLGNVTLYAQWEVYTGPCGSESFNNIPTANSSYLSRTWTGDNGGTWNATAARTDQTINGKAIATNGTGTVTSPVYPGGMGVLTFNYVRAFTGTNARTIQVWVNGLKIGDDIVVSTTSNTVQSYSAMVNVSNNVQLELRTSGAQIKIDDISWTCYTPCTSPTTQATNFTATNILATTATVNWTRGNGDAVLVLAKASAPVDADPVLGAAYTANANFGTGSQIGTGNYVVYNGAGTLVNLTGLTAGINYHFAVYEYDTTTNCYQLLNPATGQLTTLAAPETPTSFTKICTTSTTQQLSWTAPEGGADGYLLVVREGAVPHSVNSINAQNQTSNLNYGLAPTFGSTTPNSRIVYQGTATDVTVTGLTNNASYTFALYAYNLNGSTAVLYSGATTTTQVAGVADVDYLAASAGESSADISWLNPSASCFDEVMAVVTTSSGITFAPSGDGSAYVADATYTTADQVVYKGTDSSVQITGLTNDTPYYIEIFVRKGNSWSKGTEIEVTPSANLTVFKPGELFFVGYDGQVSGSGIQDEFLIATLVGIKKGTAFSFVNSRYEAGAAANVRTDKWGGSGDDASLNPGVAKIKYNGNTPIAPGSILKMNTDRTLQFLVSVQVIGLDKVIRDATADFSAELPYGITAVPNLNSGDPDQIYLVQGDFISDGNIQNGEANYILKGTLLHGLTNQTPWVPLTSANSGGTNANNRTSRLPAMLECFNLESSGSSTISAYYQNSQLHEGSFRDIMNAVNTTGNWTYGTGRYTVDPTSNASNRAGKPFARGVGKPDGTWVSTSDTNWYYCSNWEELRVPDRRTDVHIGDGTAQAIIDSNASFSDVYKDIAEVKSMTIDGTGSVKMGASSNNHFIINGSLSVADSGTLDLSGSSGSINISGNWNTSASAASFKEGSSTVNFVGKELQVINGNNHDAVEEFYHVNLDNSFDTSLSNNLIANGDLTVQNGRNIIIAPNDYFKVGKKLTHLGTPSEFIIQNDGQLWQLENLQNVGRITVQREMNFTTERLEYNYLTSMVEEQNMKTLFGNSAANTRYVLKLNEETNLFVSATADDYKIKGKGFDPAIADMQYQAQFVGKPNNGTFTTPITKTYASRGWNLIGNPYPSNLDLKQFYEDNKDLNDDPKIHSEFRFWDNRVNKTYVQYGGAYQGYSYAIYNADSNEGNPAPGGDPGNNSTTPSTPAPVDGLYRYAKVGQGFVVRAAAMGSANLEYKNTQRTLTQPDRGFFGRNEIQKDRYRLQLITPDSLTMTQTILYIPNGLNSVGLEDSKHPNSNASDAFYSVEETSKLLINAKAPFQITDKVLLGNNHFIAGEYKIRAVNKLGIFADGQAIYLKDKKMNVMADLTQGDYTFTSEAGVFSDRFEIVYQPETVLATEGTTKASLEVYRDAEDFVIRSSEKAIELLELYDASGKLILSQKGNGKELRFAATILAEGMYVVKTRLKDGQEMTKKIRK